MHNQTFLSKLIIAIIISVFVVILPFDSKAQDPTSAPEINTFATNQDNLGAIGNSINLFTGDVNLPLNLISLPGRGGLDVNVSLLYSSNVQNIVDTWNVETPTGILGLGWSMDYERIIVDHKNTGNRDDDDFYLIAGGASNLLVRTGTDGSANVYETQNCQFWKIRYYPADEKWEITRENGITYVYGDQTNHPTTVQWGVKWNNWIGSSSLTTGQQQFAIGWNISRIYDNWGNQVLFEYENIEEAVGFTTNNETLTLDLNESDDFFIYSSQTVEITGHLNEGEIISVGDYPGGSNIKTIIAPYDDYDVDGSFVGNANTTYYVRLDEGFESPSGESLSEAHFHYTTHVGSSNIHTKASYLKKITDIYGRTVDFNYDEKYGALNPDPNGKIEYEDSHSELAEPDAYQEKYETRCLDNIEVFNTDAEKLFTIQLSYDFFGSGDLTKRLLTEVTHKNPDNESLPGLKFQYRSTDPNRAALETITLPYGGSRKYVYSNPAKVLGKSNRELTISAPSGFTKPRVWIAPDYVVITWLGECLLTDCVKVFVYTWDGRWIEQELTGFISGITNDKQNFEVLIENDFFGILENYHDDTSNKTLHLYHRKRSTSNSWDHYSESISMGGSGKAEMASGDGFAAILAKNTGELSRYIYKWDEVTEDWYWDKNVYTPSGSVGPYHIAGAENYLIYYDRNEGNLIFYDLVTIWFLNENYEWDSCCILQGSLGAYSEGEATHWHTGKQFAVAMRSENVGKIIHWDENFDFTDNIYTFSSMPDYSLIYINDSQIGIYDKFTYQYDKIVKLYRFNGNEWQYKDFSSTNPSSAYVSYSFGADIALKRHHLLSETHYWKRIEFDPNAANWGSEFDLSSSLETPYPHASNNYYVFGDKVYHRKHDGDWDYFYTIPASPTPNFISLRHGAANFTTFENTNGGIATYGFIVKNEQAQSFSASYRVFDENTVYQKSQLTGPAAFVNYHSFDFDASSQLTLHRVINDDIDGNQIDYPVVRVESFDGYQTTYTSYDYNTPTATIDPTGTVAQYDQIKVVPGSATPLSNPYGYTIHYFFNGLPHGESSVSYPPNDTYTNVRDYYSLIKGLPYKTEAYDDQDNLISSSTNYWTVFDKQLGVRDVGHYSRLMKTEQTLDNVTVSSVFDYHAETGLLNKTTETNSNSAIRITQNTFAFEEYSDMEDNHMLSQVVQQTVYESSVSTANAHSSVVTTYKDWGSGKWGVKKSYVWREDDPTKSLPGFNFGSWSDGTEPTEPEWIRSGYIESRDSYGNILETKDVNDIHTTTLWGHDSSIPIATIVNATAEECFYDDFESGDFSGQVIPWGYHSVGSSTVEITSEEAFTGKYSVKFTKNDNEWIGVYMNAPFVQVTPGQPYTITAWYKCEPGRYAYINWYDQTNGQSYLKMQEGTGNWELIEHTITAPTDPPCSQLRVYLYGYYGSSNTPIYYDDVRVSPDDALMATQSYDPDFLLLYGLGDENSYITHYIYDDFNRLIEARNSNNETLTEKEYYFSVEGNGGNFNPNDPNYLTTTTHRDASSTIISKTYLDGLGRQIQSQTNQGSGSIKTATLYDNLGHPEKAILPFYHSTQAYNSNPLASAITDYSTHKPYSESASSDVGSYPYSQSEYDSDPLSRVTKQAAPGTAYRMGNDKEMVFQYLANSAGDVSGYTANSLYKRKACDENGRYGDTYVDKFGNTVAATVDPGGLNIQSRYTYDILGNPLSFIDPKGFTTTYEYNTLSQLTKEDSPDANATEYLYDKKGNLRFVKDGKGVSAPDDYFIYYKYDAFDRQVEEGTVTNLSQFTQANADDPQFPSSGNTTKAQYNYDYPHGFSGEQRNLRGRLESISYSTDRFELPGNIFYSYDEDGNIERIDQYIPTSDDANGYLSTSIEYEYDQLGGATKTHFYQSFPPGANGNDFYTWYEYDELARLEKVYSNTIDVQPATPDAEYSYWSSGQVKRTVLGDDVQGVDYLYNSRGWLTQINHHDLNSTMDPGNDSNDRFGQAIGYDNVGLHVGQAFSATSQYNGNISWTTFATEGNTNPSEITGWVHGYNSANRLTSSNWAYKPTSGSWTASNSYDLSSLSYDDNGNIVNMTRYDKNGSATAMAYNYYANSNQLNYVSGYNGQSSGNYVYDANGSMVKDIAKLGSSNTLTYNYRNLPTRIPAPGGTIEMDYDNYGQRIYKDNFVYVYGANGQVAAVYSIERVHMYWNLWGGGLIGQKFWDQQ